MQRLEFWSNEIALSNVDQCLTPICLTHANKLDHITNNSLCLKALRVKQRASVLFYQYAIKANRTHGMEMAMDIRFGDVAHDDPSSICPKSSIFHENNALISLLEISPRYSHFTIHLECLS